MHAEAYEWVKGKVEALPPRAHVVEIGSRDINGTIRPVFEQHGVPDGVRYDAVDIVDGPGVDIVADGASYRPDSAPDTVVSMEMLEHYEAPEKVVANMIAMLAPGGVLLITTATDPRPPHSAVDGYALKEGEHYRNITKTELEGWLAPLEDVEVERHGDRGDLYAVGRKPAKVEAKMQKAPDNKMVKAAETKENDMPQVYNWKGKRYTAETLDEAPDALLQQLAESGQLPGSPLGTVEEVLADVKAGKLSPAVALAAERGGKGRVTLITALEEMVADADADAAEGEAGQ